jgi:lysophospholipase
MPVARSAFFSVEQERAVDRGSLVSIPANPVPEGAVSGRINTCDGVGLRFAHWQDSLKRRGTICLFPGRGEFIEKYFETVRDLRIRGFAVAALDWRGQGFSDRLLPDPRKGHVHDFGALAKT